MKEECEHPKDRRYAYETHDEDKVGGIWISATLTSNYRIVEKCLDCGRTVNVIPK